MRTATASLLMLVVGLLLGCARPPLDPAADRTARAFFAAVQTGDRAGIDAQVAAEVAADPRRFQVFDQVRAATPAGAPREARTVGWETVNTPGGPRTSAIHLYRYTDGDLVVRTNLQPAAGGFRVVNVVVGRPPPGAIDASRFTLAGKSLAQYGFMATALLSPLVMVGVALMALFTRELSFRPVWALLAFVGVGSAMMNWTTGQGGFDPAQVSFIDVGLRRASDISPWIIRFSPPLGAILVLIRLVFVKAREPEPA
jgi:hypothetical protein